MSCSVSRPVSCPDVPVSARVRRTRADTGTRGMIQGVIQNMTCNNLFITYIQKKHCITHVLSCMYGAAFVVDV